MSCLATKLVCALFDPKLNLRYFVKNASTSINYSQQICTSRILLHQYNQSMYREQRRAYAFKENPCRKKTRVDKQRAKEEKEKEKKANFFTRLFKRPKRKPPIETCRYLRALNAFKEEKIPDFIDEMCKDLPDGGCIYKTKGRAFILEVPCERKQIAIKSRPERLLCKIERDKQFCEIEDETNPMPRFRTVGQRMIDLQERKLHPLFKKYELPEDQRCKDYGLTTKYQCSGLGEDPKTVKKGWDYCYKRKKFLFNEFKMAVLPSYIQNKSKVLEINKQSVLEFTPLQRLKRCKNKYQYSICPDLDCEEYHRRKKEEKTYTPCKPKTSSNKIDCNELEKKINRKK